MQTVSALSSPLQRYSPSGSIEGKIIFTRKDRIVSKYLTDFRIGKGIFYHESFDKITPFTLPMMCFCQDHQTDNYLYYDALLGLRRNTNPKSSHSDNGFFDFFIRNSSIR